MKIKECPLFLLISLVAVAGCRKIEIVVPSEYELIPDGIRYEADPLGMYVVNEGNMSWDVPHSSVRSMAESFTLYRSSRRIREQKSRAAALPYVMPRR